VPPPTPELGLMIQVGAQNMITGQWWTALFPGLCLAVTVLAFSLFGDNLRVFLDPTNRR
jgi:peptide/nickel transport system permease protein